MSGSALPSGIEPRPPGRPKETTERERGGEKERDLPVEDEA